MTFVVEVLTDRFHLLQYMASLFKHCCDPWADSDINTMSSANISHAGMLSSDGIAGGVKYGREIRHIKIEKQRAKYTALL